MAADAMTPPTDEEVDAVFQRVIGEYPNRRSVRLIIEAFQRMRCDEPERTEGWLTPEMAAAARRMGME